MLSGQAGVSYSGGDDDQMTKLKIFVAESLSPKDFYRRQWEGRVVEEIVRLLNGKTSYRIVMNESFLDKAIKYASNNEYNVFHLSCHGNEAGVKLSDETEICWKDLADRFQNTTKSPPTALVLSSCAGGDRGIALAFKKCRQRPQVIFGDEAENITFHDACISWSILYTALAAEGFEKEVFQDAVDRMNQITPHQFVYRRWDKGKYRRYPAAP